MDVTEILKALETSHVLPYDQKEPVKLMQRVKIAHSFLQSVSNQFHFIILRPRLHGTG